MSTTTTLVCPGIIGYLSTQAIRQDQWDRDESEDSKLPTPKTAEAS